MVVIYNGERVKESLPARGAWIEMTNIRNCS